MFAFYIVFVFLQILLIAIFKKRTLVLLSSSIFIILVLNQFDYFDFSVDVIDTFQNILSNVQIIFLLVAIVLVYLISELIIILGIQNNFEKLVDSFKIRNQKVFVLIFSSFGTTFDIKELTVLQKFKKIYNQSIILTKSLNLFSVDMITILLILLMISMAYAPVVYGLLFATNFFAIFFVLKRIIDFKTDVYIDYKYIPERLTELKSSTVKRNVNYPHITSILIRTLLYVLIYIAVYIFIDLSIYLILFLILLSIFIDLLVSAIVYSFNTKQIDEIYIYSSLFGAIKNIIRPVAFALVSLIYINVMFEAMYSKVFILNFGINQMILIIFFLSIIASYLLSNALVGFVFALPFYAIFVRSEFFDYNSQTLFYMLFGLLFFVNFISVLELKNRPFIVYFDLAYMFVVSMLCYILYYFTSSLLYSYLIIVIFIVLYFLISKLYKRSDKI